MATRIAADHSLHLPRGRVSLLLAAVPAISFVFALLGVLAPLPVAVTWLVGQPWRPLIARRRDAFHAHIAAWRADVRLHPWDSVTAAIVIVGTGVAGSARAAGVRDRTD